MPKAVPAQRADSIARLHSQPFQTPRNGVHAGVKVRVRMAMHDVGHLAGDLFFREKFGRTLQDVRERQRVIHHQTLHTGLLYADDRMGFKWRPVVGAGWWDVGKAPAAGDWPLLQPTIHNLPQPELLHLVPQRLAVIRSIREGAHTGCQMVRWRLKCKFYLTRGWRRVHCSGPGCQNGNPGSTESGQPLFQPSTTGGTPSRRVTWRG